MRVCGVSKKEGRKGGRRKEQEEERRRRTEKEERHSQSLTHQYSHAYEHKNTRTHKHIRSLTMALARSRAKQVIARLLRETKAAMEAAVPFAIEPVLYDWDVNHCGTTVSLLLRGLFLFSSVHSIADLV